jgi:hypothetical protein
VTGKAVGKPPRGANRNALSVSLARAEVRGLCKLTLTDDFGDAVSPEDATTGTAGMR